MRRGKHAEVGVRHRRWDRYDAHARVDHHRHEMDDPNVAHGSTRWLVDLSFESLDFLSAVCDGTEGPPAYRAACLFLSR